jgi:hypothetical protein
VGTQLITIAVYLPHPTTTQGKLEYEDILRWIARLLNDKYPHHPILMGGDLQGATLRHHITYRAPLE